MTKIALVTGGGLRIGRAVARALAGAGYAVAIHYNNSKDSAAALAAEITAAGGKARTLGQDLADIPGSQALVGRAAELMGGPVSLLINSASLYLAESLDDLTPEQWQLIFVNRYGIAKLRVVDVLNANHRWIAEMNRCAVYGWKTRANLYRTNRICR